MHGEVILCSKDVFTVGAVTNKGLSLTRIIDCKSSSSAWLGARGERSHNCMAAADSVVVLFSLDVQWDLAQTH